ncbi:hypothetical protein CSE45_0708 [Citreicella sp. SE45]|nr:hypothetical protein CSE45_0708 [Citreicella sp. SE45]
MAIAEILGVEPVAEAVPAGPEGALPPSPAGDSPGIFPARGRQGGWSARVFAYQNDSVVTRAG